MLEERMTHCGKPMQLMETNVRILEGWPTTTRVDYLCTVCGVEEYGGESSD